MTETRFGKLGRFEAQLIKLVIEKIIPESQREDYTRRFLVELKKYSDKGRKKGEPRNEGCVWELEDTDNLDIYNPENFARFLKEIHHKGYQKQNSKRERGGLFGNL